MRAWVTANGKTILSKCLNFAQAPIQYVNENVDYHSVNVVRLRLNGYSSFCHRDRYVVGNIKLENRAMTIVDSFHDGALRLRPQIRRARKFRI